MLRALVTFAATEAEGHTEGGVAALGLNVGSLLIQLATFAIIFFILKKFAFNKILHVLDERRDKIEESLKLAEEMEKRNEKSQAETEKALATARKEADALITRAHEEAGAVIKESEERAARQTEQMVADAHSRIGADLISAKNELKKEMLGLVAEAAEIVVGEKIDSQADRRLIERAISRERS